MMAAESGDTKYGIEYRALVMACGLPSKTSEAVSGGIVTRWSVDLK